MLWLPVGYTLGYLVLLVVVAAPMRRSGAYTLPDFAEARLGSRAIRLMSSLLVVGIGWLYLVPQFQGASLTLTLVTGAPAWVGGFVVMVVVALAVGAGGMRSITFVQAVQYWIKLTALAVPAFVLLALWFRSGSPAPQVDPSWNIPLAPTVPTTTRPTARHPPCSPCASARWVCPTCSCATTRTPTASVPGAPPSPSSRCSAPLPVPTGLRRARPGGLPDAAAGVRPDTIVLRLPETLLPGLRRPAADGDARGRCVRGLPVHGIRSGHVGHRRHRPGAAAAQGDPGRRWWRARHPWVPGRRGARGGAFPYAVSRRHRVAGAGTRSGWRSRWPPRPSRRSSCSGSGGARLWTWGAMAGLVAGGTAAPARSAGPSPPDRKGGWARSPARQPGDVGDPTRPRDDGRGLAGHAVADARRNPANDGAAAHARARGPGPLPDPATDANAPGGSRNPPPLQVLHHEPWRRGSVKVPAPYSESSGSGRMPSADGVARGHERVDAGPHVVLGVRRRQLHPDPRLPLGTTGKLNAMT